MTGVQSGSSFKVRVRCDEEWSDWTWAVTLAAGARGALALVSFGLLAEEGPEWGLPVSPDEVVIGRLTRRNP